MKQYRIRIFVNQSYWQDIIISAENGYAAQKLAEGQSPVGKAILLGEA